MPSRREEADPPDYKDIDTTVSEEEYARADSNDELKCVTMTAYRLCRSHAWPGGSRQRRIYERAQAAILRVSR